MLSVYINRADLGWRLNLKLVGDSVKFCAGSSFSFFGTAGVFVYGFEISLWSGKCFLNLKSSNFGRNGSIAKSSHFFLGELYLASC